MSQQPKRTFQLTILAAAVLSLSACSYAPKMPEFDLGAMGEGLGKVGSKTMELGAVALDTTIDLLYIGDRPKPIDEVDLALMEEDASLGAVEIASIDDATMPEGVELESLELGQNLDQDVNFGDIPDLNAAEIAEVANESLSVEDATIPEPGDLLAVDTSLGADTELLDVDMNAASTVETVAAADMTHVVNPSETLWDIAKKTTGDANNWHVIADINNLAPDASVRVGQKLVIPADMVKPSLAIAALEAEAAPVAVEIEQAAVALVVPEKQVEEVVAAAEPTAPANPADIMENATMIKVAQGETLWDFTKRTTGDATNWKLIADKNLFNEKQIAAIRPGQKIFVPSDMVRQRDENGVLIAKADEVDVTIDQEALVASAAVLAGTNLPDGDVKIVEAAFQGDDVINPVTAESLSTEAATAVAAIDENPSKVMVSGTYYPKAVYNEADFSSSLLMRVSPGTKLMVSKAIGPWLQVETEQGTGYLHSRDIK